MLLSDFIEECQELLKEYGDHELVYSIDDEGNAFNRIHYGPTVGNYTDGEWCPRSNFEGDKIVNAVCVN
jgi:hypothetical protein